MLAWLHRDVRISVRCDVVGRSPSTATAFPAYLVKVSNASRVRRAVVTDVWFEAEPAVPLIARRPPGVLRPAAEWETFLPASSIPGVATDVERRFRVRLSSGEVLSSEAA